MVSWKNELGSILHIKKLWLPVKNQIQDGVLDLQQGENRSTFFKPPTGRLSCFILFLKPTPCDLCVPYLVTAITTTDQTHTGGCCRMLCPGADDTIRVLTLIDFNPKSESSALWSTSLHFTQTRRHCAIDFYPLALVTISSYSFTNLFENILNMKKP